VDALNARGTLEMAAEVAGGSAALRSRPLVSALLCSVSPLAYHKDALEAAFLYGQAGIPTGFMSMSISCATAPATLAGSAALVNAEVLAGIVLLQLFFPGLPTYYGSCATMLELTTGGITAGGPEDCLLQAAACQLSHYYGLPANVGTFATGAKTSGWQAGLENALSGLVSQASGADMMCGAGQLYGARIFSFEQLLMDCEIYDLICALMQGFEVDEETLALDLIQSTGPQNNFLATGHTRTHMHEVWQPAILDRSAWADWVQRGRPAPSDEAHAVAARFFAGGEPSPRELRQETLKALSSYHPEPPPFAGRLREIVSEYEKM
jgi:trimethylamine--corrinoid protein Co-methyltransferase